jgi:LytS/YehU family sensor histidine kinase
VLGFLVYTVLASVESGIRTTAELRQREAAAARTEAFLARAELQAIRAQLDPHFLFNTLHSILALVRKDPGSVEDALERFAELLRYVLAAHRGPGGEVLLADEGQFTSNYLALERLRLGERLRIVEEIDPETLDCRLPAFCLQPLVENAIHHAVAPRASGGKVHIRTAFQDGSLRLEVTDDGPGTSPEAATSTSGLGLRALRDLLRRYADEARLELLSPPGAGCLARVTLPVVGPVQAIGS